MSIIVKKYTQYRLASNRKKEYEFSCSLGSSIIGTRYIIMLFQELGIDNIFDYSQNDDTEAGDDFAAFRIFLKNGIRFVGIIRASASDFYQVFDEDPYRYSIKLDDLFNLLINIDQDWLDQDFHDDDDEPYRYVVRLDDFLTIAKKYKQYLAENIPCFYLIQLSNNHVVSQTDLTNIDFRFPEKWLEYVKVAYLKDDNAEKDNSCYDKVEKTSTELRWFFWLNFRLNSHDKIFDYYEKHSEGQHKNIHFQDVKTMLETWEQLKTKENPVYFVKNDAGAIEVRKSILSLRHVLLARAQDGSYEIKDECGIDVFDFLEEFALGFSPERFLEEYEQPAFSDEIHAVHKHIEVTYSKQENFIRLKLGKAPCEFEYIERERDDYFECRLFEMSLHEFVALMSYWRTLKEKAAPEIYFTQRDDGALVIREGEI